MQRFLRLKSNFLIGLVVPALLLSSFGGAYGETCNSWLCGLNGLRGQSAFEEISKFEFEESQRVLREYKGLAPEIQKRLTEFEQEVAASSYRRTLQLCVAYRDFAGYGKGHPVNLNGSTGISNVLEARDVSTRAWALIAAKGLVQPLDAALGLKAEYLKITGAGVFDFSSWFRSMYVLKFLNSAGFLYGAVHCLNSVDSREIHNFASSILTVDFWGSVAGEGVLGSTVGRLVGAVVGRWALQPLKYAFSKLDMARFKPALVLSSGAAVTLLGDEFNCRHALNDLNTEGVLSLTRNIISPEHKARHRRIETAIKVAQAYDRFQTDCRGNSEISIENSTCGAALKGFVATVRQTRFDQDLAAYKYDLDQAPVNGDNELTHTVRHCGLSDSVIVDVTKSEDLDKTYSLVLGVLVPAVEKFNFLSN